MNDSSGRRTGGEFLFVIVAAIVLAGAMSLAPPSGAAGQFRISPYVQNPSPQGITIVWFAEGAANGILTHSLPGGPETVTTSTSVLASALTYGAAEVPLLPGGVAPALPYRHEVQLTDLTTDTLYVYSVNQAGELATGSFRTAPARDQAVRFIVYSDSETEPESTGKLADWADPAGLVTGRKYVVDQTRGYEENLEVMKSRQPGFVLIAGDLAESGGEQRDWDEFWLRNTGLHGSAASIPIFPVLGNHEYYGGSLGGYNQPASETAVAKFKTYFDVPSNGAPNGAQEERYYRVDYGPVTLLVIDCVNGLPDDSAQDSNWYLLGETEGGQAPDYNPGSRQYEWIEAQLADAQKTSLFTFVSYHHVPYSSGPHGWPPGGGDDQSGIPTRVLEPLFLHYGVDALLCGHDEMYERSVVTGTETLPGGGTQPATLHIYDAGIGGDGLRGPTTGVANPKQVYFAHDDAPEVYDGDGVLLSGGKHYGHLEINVEPVPPTEWRAVITPVHVFPLMQKVGENLVVNGFERRTYADEITLTTTVAPANSGVSHWLTW